ncbi:hypothetical protein H6504_04395 [Candidatus Woesearchaeota archaeon]|nr:hypothetical protein [Candidatus Woesearchaeota archaeon]
MLDITDYRVKVDKELKNIPIPAFEEHAPDIPLMKHMAERFADKKNIIVVGYGGSNTSFLTLNEALYEGEKHVELLNTTEPDVLHKVRETCSPQDSVVIAISKSGTTMGVLETVLFLKDYPTIVVTEPNGKALHEYAKRLSLPIVEHPPVGGRFSARTATSYLPAALLGIDIEKVERGFIKAYEHYGPDILDITNPAYTMAQRLYELELQGKTELYIPIYVRRLYGLSTLIIQLMHESVCKAGTGQTIYTALAPEAQHHTNQRLFGGRQNLATLFLTLQKTRTDETLNVPEELKSIILKDVHLNVFQGLPLSTATHFEFQGTWENSLMKNIPSAHIALPKLDEEHIGELIGFFQYLAVYSSYLRDVDPFDQPHVEDSKNITYDLIKDYSDPSK